MGSLGLVEAEAAEAGGDFCSTAPPQDARKTLIDIIIKPFNRRFFIFFPVC
jgi:hypothetical protein